MAWHMMILDTQTWLIGEVPGLGLTDEDVSLLREVDLLEICPRDNHRDEHISLYP
jgi:hypothetical protein